MYIGVDLGGTNVAAAIVSSDGIIAKQESIPVKQEGGADSVTGSIIDVCDKLLDGEKDELSSIGVGVPAQVRDDIGVVVFSPNLPLRNVPLAKKLADKYGCKVRLGNDANCAVLGEAVAGSAKGHKDVTMITLGTGLGGGLIIGGKLHTGLSGCAGELGHMVVIAGGRECGCGRRGCWEKYASASGLIKTTIANIENRKDSLIWEYCNGNTGALEGKMIFDAYRKSDEAAIDIVLQYSSHLAIGIVNIINIIEPELFCVGGGISHAWDCLERPLREAIEAEKFSRFATDIPQMKLVRAKLGNAAGLIGAAMLGREIL